MHSDMNHCMQGHSPLVRQLIYRTLSLTRLLGFAHSLSLALTLQVDARDKMDWAEGDTACGLGIIALGHSGSDTFASMFASTFAKLARDTGRPLFARMARLQAYVAPLPLLSCYYLFGSFCTHLVYSRATTQLKACVSAFSRAFKYFSLLSAE